VVTSFASFIVAFVVIYLMKGIDLYSYAWVMSVSLLIGQVFFVYIFVRKNMPVKISKLLKGVFKVSWLPVVLTVLYYIAKQKWFVFDGYKALIIHVVVFNIVLLASMWFVSFTEADRKMILRR